jgi:hypothetical protein
MEGTRRAVKIQATYWISNADESSSSDAPPTRIQSFGPASPSTETHTAIDTPARMGLPEGVHAEKRPAGDDSYSGMHDQGPLPPLKEGGSMAMLLSCAQEAKKFNDQYLTEMIAAQKKKTAKIAHGQSDAGESSDLPLKRAKVDSDDPS